MKLLNHKQLEPMVSHIYFWIDIDLPDLEEPYFKIPKEERLCIVHQIVGERIEEHPILVGRYMDTFQGDEE